MGIIRDRMEADLKLKAYSASTQRRYLLEARRFVAFHGRCPTELGEAEVRAYFHHRVSQVANPTSLLPALAAVTFLYRVTLMRPDVVARLLWPRQEYKLPDILTFEEVHRLLEAVARPVSKMVLVTLYATGCRISEACQLEVTDIDSVRGVIKIRQGKGKKAGLSVLRSGAGVKSGRGECFVFSV